MSFEIKPTQDLVQILEAGASLSISKGVRMDGDWLELARAVKKGGGRLTITDVGLWPTQTIIKISVQAPGRVTFVE